MYVPNWALPGYGSVTTDISTATIDRGGYTIERIYSFSCLIENWENKFLGNAR
jgi:hypothetical protein